MLNNLHKHGIFSRSSEHYKLLLQQNKILVKEIKEMKSEIDIDSYTAANNLYRKIIKEVNIRLFRILLKEQYSGCQENDLDIDFLYDYDDNNIRNARFFRQIIFNRKIRNIIKHAVLKKFFKQRDDPDELFKILIDLLEKFGTVDPTKEALRCIIIEGLLAKKIEFIKKAKGILKGGGDELKGGYENELKGGEDGYENELKGGGDELRGEDGYGEDGYGEDGYGEDGLRGEDGYEDGLRGEDGYSEDGLDEHRLRGEELVDELNENELIGGATPLTISLNGIFAFIALECHNQQITDACQKCIVLVDKDEAERINLEIDKTLKDTSISNNKKSIYFVHIVDPSKVNKSEIIQSIASLYETEVNKRKIALFNAVIHSNSANLTKELGDIICEAGGSAIAEHLEDLIARTDLQNILTMINVGAGRRNFSTSPLKLYGNFILTDDKRKKIHRCLQAFRSSTVTPSVHEFVDGGRVFFRIIFGVYIENTLGDRKIHKILPGVETRILGIDPEIQEIIKLYTASQHIVKVNAATTTPRKVTIVTTPPDECLTGDINTVSNVYVAIPDPIANPCIGEIGYYNVTELNMKFVKVIFNGSISDMSFQDKDCPTDSSRPSTAAGMVGGAMVGSAMVDGAMVDGAMVDGAMVDGAMVDGAMVDGAYYKKYLKYKNKYLLNKNI